MSNSDFSNAEAPVVLSIASSDSGAGSGVQADIKTFSAFGVFGTCAITAITSQTPTELRAIELVTPEVVTSQILAVSDGFPIAAAKTGMLYTPEHVECVASADVSQGIPVLVVDPRMVSHVGKRLMQADAVEKLKDTLLPLARVVTPNIHEAEILYGRPISNLQDLREAARVISETFDIACVVKGGNLDTGEEVVDILADEGELYEYTAPRLRALENHGAGCTFSAAMTACIAKGMLMSESVKEAKDYTHTAILRALSIGHHQPLNHFCM